MNRSPLRRGLLLIPLALACFALSPQARAVCQQGCLSSNNTTLGEDALLDLTTGTDNTALGFNALLSDTTGTHNTGVGSQALTSNTIGGSNVAIGWQTLFSNQDGNSNVAIGDQALYENISGNEKHRHRPTRAQCKYGFQQHCDRLLGTEAQHYRRA